MSQDHKTHGSSIVLTERGLGQLLTALAPQQTLSKGETKAIIDLDPRVAQYAPRTVINSQGDQNDTTYFVYSGWGCTYVDLPDGSRQIADFQLRGDIIGLRADGATWEESFHAISEMIVLELSTKDINAALGAAPKLAIRFLFALARKSAIRGEHLVNIGRRSASVRLSHLLLELGARLEAVGLAGSEGYDCPLTQHDLADALGLTAIHVNRMLRELRQSDLLSFRNGKVVFPNPEAVATFAHFDGDYL